MKNFLVLGLLVVIIPLLGIPMVWKTLLLVLLGLYIIFSAVNFNKKDNKDSREKKSEEDSDRVFVENEENFEEE